MELKSEQELTNTREKLKRLEELYEQSRDRESGGAYARELSLRSIRRTINQLKEEIARYEAHHGAVR